MVKKKVKPLKKKSITNVTMAKQKVKPPITLPKDEKKENLKKTSIANIIMADQKVKPPLTLSKDEKEENLKKLSDSSIVVNFVENNKGCWNHQTWLEFCDTLAKECFTPIDFEQVGILLETQKASYIAAGR